MTPATIGIGSRLRLDALRSALSDRRPQLVVRSQAWRPTLHGPLIQALRRELRGLGAVLLAITPAGVWRLDPHDDPEPVALAPAQTATPTLPHAECILVIDEHDVVQCIRVPETSVETELLGAAVEAGRQLRAAPPVSMSRREWAVACLCRSFRKDTP
jgi:hypothetical protein